MLLPPLTAGAGTADVGTGGIASQITTDLDTAKSAVEVLDKVTAPGLRGSASRREQNNYGWYGVRRYRGKLQWRAERKSGKICRQGRTKKARQFEQYGAKIKNACIKNFKILISNKHRCAVTSLQRLVVVVIRLVS